MKKHYTLLAIASLALSLLACEKETITAAQPEAQAQMTPQQKLDGLALPLILFQYSYIDLESGEETGWVIDRKGRVKAYRSTLPPGTTPSSENEKWEEADLSALYHNAAEPITTIEAEELLARIREGMDLSPRALSEASTDEGASWSSGFYAFTQAARKSNTDSNASEECDYEPEGEAYGAHDSEINITRLIVDLSGRINRNETSDAATSLHAWLQALNEGL